MKALSIAIAKKLTYACAILIIVIAIVVAITHLYIPALDNRRADFENWASEILGAPVSINKARFDWYQYYPEVSLYNVTILDEKTKEPAFQIKKVRIFFSIPKSIREWKPVLSTVMISGTDLNVEQSENGFVVQGFPEFGGISNEPFKTETKFYDVINRLSVQPQLILQDVDIHYKGLTGQNRLVTVFNIGFENNGDTHVIRGRAMLHQDIPTELEVVSKWRGQTFDPEKIKLKIYFYVSGLSLSQWWSGLKWQSWEVKDGIASAKFWLSWNQGTWQKIQSTFQFYDLDLASDIDKSRHRIQRLSGDAGWKRQGNDQVVAADDVLIDLPGHYWPATSFYILLSPDSTGKLQPKVANIGYINIPDVTKFLFSSPPVLSTDILQTIKDLNIRGYLQNINVTFSEPSLDWQKATLTTAFSHLYVSAWHSYPEIRNASGKITINSQQGDLNVNSQNIVFLPSSIFTNSLAFEQLTGNVHWEKENDLWTGNINQLNAKNLDLDFSINGGFKIPTNKSPDLDLTATFNVQQLKRIVLYLPMKILDVELVEWLRHAFLAGRAQSGKAVIRGNLSDFPFDKGNGEFSISTDVRNVDLKFAPDWPAATNINAKLAFSGRRIDIDADQAKIMGIATNKLHADIPYLGDEKPEILYLKTTDILADFGDGLRFVHASPLEKKIGKMFKDVEVVGPMALKLELEVPLKNPDETKVKGVINLKDTTMKLVPWHLDINKLSGNVNFSEKTTDSNDLAGELFNKPIAIQLMTLEKTKDISIVQASTNTNLSVDDLEKWLKIPFSKVITGATDVSTVLDLSFDEPINVHLKSTLVGAAINLPGQYAKKAEEPRAFTADITIDQSKPLQVRMAYGDFFNAALVLENKMETFNLISADVHFGTGLATFPEGPGIYISGNFDKLDWDTIKKYSFTEGAATANPTTNFGSLPLKSIDINAKNLELLGQVIENVNIQIIPIQNMWNVLIDSPDVAGQIQVPANFSNKSNIDIKFHKLHLVPSPNPSTMPVNLKEIPFISFLSENTSYNNIPLGRVEFSVVPNGGGVKFKNITINAKQMDLEAKGDWTQNGQTTQTHLKGSIESQNVSDLLDSFGFDVHNFIAKKGNLDFNLSWAGAPFTPALSSLNGQAALEIGDGRIVDVGEASAAKMDLGRMLSIFSLQTIPRRLSLNFSDVFQKGYSFDSFKGDFNFTRGNAFTTNTNFDGPVAKIGINGRIGLAQKDYDFTLSVTPYVTSSLPIAATLLTGQPLIGLATMAVTTVIGSQVSKATTYYYSVRGPWSNPSWDEIKSSASVGNARRG